MSAYTFLETLLEAHGSPLDIFLIFQEAGDRWSQQTLTNALQGDPRFVRTDKSRYGLSKWGLEKYEGISNEIRKIIEADGPMHIDQIVQRLTLWFDVEESSVRSYALDAPFEQINGIVALKAPDAIKAPTFQSLLPRQIVDITQHSGGFDWVLKINADHLRGSGFNAKIAIASILGMFSGETVSLTINETEHFMKVYWTKKQPFIGSIKAPLVLLGAKEGDKLRIRFNGNEGKIENADFSLIP
jgi:hypothetical protein